MKNPNRYGSVTKLSGNRRKPFMVREGMSGQQKVVGYAETKEAALIMLAEYNRQPWDIDNKSITFAKVFESWLKSKGNNFSKGRIETLTCVYNRYCKPLRTMRYVDIRAYHLQEVINSNQSTTQPVLKSLFTHLDNYAYEHDIISKKYGDLTTVKTYVQKGTKTIFTDEEINILWNLPSSEVRDVILILLYTGMRIGELLNLPKSGLDTDEWIITGGSKTTAGKNRQIPVHQNIKPLLEQKLLSTYGDYIYRIKKSTFRLHWQKFMSDLNMDHTPHECRHTFRTRLDNAGANKIAIDLLMGHKSKDVGERVYTHKTIDQLRETVELLA